MADAEAACTYACLLLHDDGVEITADKIQKVLDAAGVKVETYWPTLFARTLAVKNMDDLITNIGSGAPVAAGGAPAAGGGGGGAAPAAEEKKKEESEEDEDMGFSLFD
ncbi:unnamed protein product [Pedinophyceae sp. YPF-701]|nr:unnamed protein product [Pedinophyceae sp. YPF-701]